jgi:hypothetical protein
MHMEGDQGNTGKPLSDHRQLLSPKFNFKINNTVQICAVWYRRSRLIPRKTLASDVSQNNCATFETGAEFCATYRRLHK